MSQQPVKSLTIEEYELCNKLKSMRFSGMAAELESVFADPNTDLVPFKDKIQRIVDAEWDLRYTKKLNRFIKKATLKYSMADLDDSIYDPARQLDTGIIEALSQCEWIDQGKKPGHNRKNECWQKLSCKRSCHLCSEAVQNSQIL